VINADPAREPVARREPEISVLHGRERVDDYAWMHHDTAALRDYLEAERRHYDFRMAHCLDLQQTLFGDMARRLAPTDRSVSWPLGKWLYYTRTTPGKQYDEFCRRPVAATDEQVLLAENDLAAGSDYFALGVREVSPDGRWLAYSVDTTGDEVYRLRIRDLTTGEDLPEVIPRSYYGFAWSADSRSFGYVVHDAAYRPDRVMRHRLGDDPAEDLTVFHEPDQRFDVTVRASRSGELVLVETASRDTAETWLLPADDLSAPPRVVEPRRRGVEYAVDHLPGPDGGRLAIVTNDEAPEFRLVTAPVATPGRAAWEALLPPSPDERVLAADCFRGHVVATLRRGGAPLLRILDLATGATRDVGAGHAAAAVRLASRDDDHEPVRDPFDSAAVTVVTESLIEPPRWWSVDLATGDRSLVKELPVRGWDPSAYETQRLHAPAADGTLVPITVARARSAPAGPRPLLLYGYGAYEACIDPWFDPAIATLLDRGVGFAIAHVRGGGECGRSWWEQGRLRRKPTTFDDHVAAAGFLAEQDWIDGSRIASRGLSAGGLLQGAVFSRAPRRWRAVVAEVPFVDVVTSMLDPDTPLTVNEWDEWGDPRDPDDFAVMAGYSPYDNPPAGERPSLLVTGSLHDARVMIREPAKWVARLRATRTDDSLLLFRPELGSAAHIGASGRFDRLRYEAEIAAFLLTAFDADTR
jgi:oligopeptidase B